MPTLRPLIIGPEEKTRIIELCAFAADNVMDPKAALNVATRDLPAFHDMMALHTVRLPVGYMVTYSHERQPFGVARHISISVDTPNKFPSVEAVEMILAAFGMAPLSQSIKVWPEQVEPGHGAVNVVQKLP